MQRLGGISIIFETNEQVREERVEYCYCSLWGTGGLYCLYVHFGLVVQTDADLFKVEKRRGTTDGTLPSQVVVD